jgi:hypothetical protein
VLGRLITGSKRHGSFGKGEHRLGRTGSGLTG